jgi:ribosomal protein S18 acetylase RimI-like enzyme
MTALPDAVRYSVYSSSDAEEMIRLLGKVFTERDPPAVAVGLTPPEFEAFVRLFCPKADTERLTVVGRCAETGEMIGALLAEDSASTPPDGVDRLSSKFNPIFDILGQLESEYRSGQAMRPGESIHLFLLGVAVRFAGQGVAQQLAAECLANGLRQGYCVAVTEATNTASQHIFRKHGFTDRVRRSYAEYQLEGEPVFESISKQGGPILMDKRLVP